MNKLVAALFALAALIFLFQTFDHMGSGNFLALVLNAVATVYTGRIAWKRYSALRLGI